MRVCRFLILALSFALPASLSAQLRCDVTCTPDTSSSTYTNGTFQARPTPPNTRAFSSPFAAHAEQDASSSSVTVGSASFNYAVPILSLPGRNGLDVNLTLYYNSRTWTIDNTNGRASFNADRDFPSYGFRLGYGSIEVSNSVYLLTEPDGSKRAFTAGLTTDSSYITWNIATLTLKRKNGEAWIYQRVGTTSFYVPVKIQDTNGNFLAIAYHTKRISRTKPLARSPIQSAASSLSTGRLSSVFPSPDLLRRHILDGSLNHLPDDKNRRAHDVHGGDRR